MSSAYVAMSFGEWLGNPWAEFVAGPWYGKLIVLGVLALFGWFGVQKAVSALGQRKIHGPATAGIARALSVHQGRWVSEGNAGIPLTTWKIRVRVEVPGREPYEATVRQEFPAWTVPTEGDSWAVEVARDDPQRIRVDFAQRIMPDSQSSGQPSDAGLSDKINAGLADPDQQLHVGSVPLAADLLATGQRVPGVLMSFSAREETADSTYSSPELRGVPLYVLGVELHIPNLAPMTARNMQPVPTAVVPKLALGLKLTCAVNPTDPARLFAVDWNELNP